MPDLTSRLASFLNQLYAGNAFTFPATGSGIRVVTGSPEGQTTGIVGDIALRLDGGVGTTLYSKTSGSGNTGWSAVSGGGGIGGSTGATDLAVLLSSGVGGSTLQASTAVMDATNGNVTWPGNVFAAGGIVAKAPLASGGTIKLTGFAGGDALIETTATVTNTWGARNGTPNWQGLAAGVLTWSSNSTFTTAADTGIARNGAGIVEINNGTAGTLRDLTLRSLITAAGTNAVAPFTFTHGTNLTNAAVDALENDGVSFYGTIDTTTGRGAFDRWQFFRLTGSGSGITTIADFFGSNDGIPLVANGVYEIEWHCYFSQATAGTATWTIVTATTNLATLTAEYLGSPVAGIGTVGTPQTAAVQVTNTASTAFPVTGTEATGATHYFVIHAILTAGNGASNTRLRLTMGAGTATPLINSYFKVRRLPAGNIGTFVA